MNNSTIFVCGTGNSYMCIDPNSGCVDDDDYVPDFDGVTANVNAAGTVAGLFLVAALGMLLL